MALSTFRRIRSRCAPSTPSTTSTPSMVPLSVSMMRKYSSPALTTATSDTASGACLTTRDDQIPSTSRLNPPSSIAKTRLA
eukprot:8969597-Alexandrium_andersonii.AAC.1